MKARNTPGEGYSNSRQMPAPSILSARLTAETASSLAKKKG